MSFVAFYNCLKQLELTGSPGEKEQIIRESIKATPAIAECFRFALSPFITFGIAKIEENISLDPLPWSNEHAFVEGMNLLVLLKDRRITGSLAISEVNFKRSHMMFDSRQAFERILLKDLRCGVAAKTVNNAVPGTIPEFGCQLAPSKMPSMEEIRFPVIAEPKLDGVRTIAVKDRGGVTLYSRTGHVFLNFEPIRESLHLLADGWVLDGEVISRAGFNNLMQRALAHKGVGSEVSLEYHVFDCMPYEHWITRKTYIQKERSEQAATLVSDIGLPNIVKKVKSVICSNADELQAFYSECVNQGYEGIIIKDLHARYAFKRNKNWRKLKPFETADLVITGLIEGTGKYVNSLGAIICQGTIQDKRIKVDVGSGFTDQERDSIWQNPARIIGCEAEVRYQEISQDQNPEDPNLYKLRFPSFLRMRSSPYQEKI